jgi:hypothetical protein
MKSRHDKLTERLDCPGCGSQDIRKFHEIQNVPTNSVLNIHTRQAALDFRRGDICLVVCSSCGFIYNCRFNPELVQYSSECEETQACSPTFSAFAESLAHDLVEKHNLYDKTIIEIGCGKGDFLNYICRLGRNSGIGFDPAYVPGRGTDSNGRPDIEFIKDYYSEKYAHFQGDLICCRMTMEHILDSADMINMVRRSIGDRTNTVVFFQVPDVTRILRDCAFEDIYYEHCAYFTPGSFARLFGRNGFDIIDLKTAYDDQYILLEAKPVDQPHEIKHPLVESIASLNNWIKEFKKSYPVVIGYWDRQLERYQREAKKVVLWGGGSKAVTFLNTIEATARIDYVVDINPFRQRTFIAGTGQQIVAPEFLKEYRPDAVIIMNAIYRQEIEDNLKYLGLQPLTMTLER